MRSAHPTETDYPEFELVGSRLYFSKDYEVMRKLGSGSYGRVYKVCHLETNSIFAMKHVCPHKEEVKDFCTPGTSIREIAIMLKLDHPNLVKAYGYIYKGPDRLYIFMEYCPRNLYTILQECAKYKRFLTPSQSKVMIKQLISGVAYLHSQGIIHRDLKSENILMGRDGQLKIADYGLARNCTASDECLTGLIQTFYYRAPQIIMKCQKYSESPDLWSLGCLMVEIITCKPLFGHCVSEMQLILELFEITGTLPREQMLKLFGKVGVKRIERAFLGIPNFPTPGAIPQLYNLGTHGYTLLRNLLSLNPNKRVSAHVALQSPYFQENEIAI